MGLKAPEFDDDSHVGVPKQFYRAVKGDYLDELLAGYINASGISMPIVRITEGLYLFGTRKITAKAQGDRLVVRVGGGFQPLEDFIKQYAETEQNKIAELKSKGEWDLDELVTRLRSEQ